MRESKLIYQSSSKEKNGKKSKKAFIHICVGQYLSTEEEKKKTHSTCIGCFNLNEKK